MYKLMTGKSQSQEEAEYYLVGGTHSSLRFWTEKAGEAGEMDGCQGECASKMDRE